MAVHACTIIARNYLPLARVLGTSFRELHPDGTLTVLVFDDIDHEVVGDDEPFDVIHIDDLGDNVPELYRMAAMYDVTEFATALKPWLLEKLLRRGAPSVLYLDPDIQVFASLEEISSLAVEHDIVLTPHAVAPMPRDGKMTSETSILASGIYNLGFIAVGSGTLRSDVAGKPPFLTFWQDRLVRECVNDPLGMRFVDQRWMDFVPAVYEPLIMREKTYNVAYWNLDHRDLVWTGTRYEIDGEPLRFFHFSGFSPGAPPPQQAPDRPTPDPAVRAPARAQDLRQLCRPAAGQRLRPGEFGSVRVRPHGQWRGDRQVRAAGLPGRGAGGRRGGGRLSAAALGCGGCRRPV